MGEESIAKEAGLNSILFNQGKEKFTPFFPPPSRLPDNPGDSDLPFSE
jgi:hypothetical protein